MTTVGFVGFQLWALSPLPIIYYPLPFNNLIDDYIVMNVISVIIVMNALNAPNVPNALNALNDLNERN